MCLVLLGNDIGDVISSWEKLFAFTFLSLAISLLQDLIPRSFKEFVVFWRVKNRLPGHRAFSDARAWTSIITKDEVVDFEIRSALGARFQDRLFYRIFENYREVPSVKHYSFRYLQWRELASTSLIASVIGYSAVAASRGWLSIEAFVALGVGVIITICSIMAARNSANELVDRVLLAESMEKSRS